MFALDEKKAKSHFHFRGIMINWLFSPGITYKELAAEAEGLWDRYYDFEAVPEHGSRDAAESWADWRLQIMTATEHLMGTGLENRQVQFIVETQVLLRPYLEARQNTHMIYQICRSMDSDALFKEFEDLEPALDEPISFGEHQDLVLEHCEFLLEQNDDVNQVIPDAGGNTLLINAVALEGELAVDILLQMPGILVNQSNDEGMTPLWCAADCGHIGTMRLLLQHPDIDTNLSTDVPRKLETPLFAAAGSGHEMAVGLLLARPDVEVNRRRENDGGTALMMAASYGYDWIVGALLRYPGIEVNLALTGKRGHEGETALFIAAEGGHEHVVRLLLSRPEIIVSTPRVRDGMTALDIARHGGHVRVVNVFLMHAIAQTQSLTQSVSSENAQAGPRTRSMKRKADAASCGNLQPPKKRK
jgi:ankyrin repeat protein